MLFNVKTLKDIVNFLSGICKFEYEFKLFNILGQSINGSILDFLDCGIISINGVALGQYSYLCEINCTSVKITDTVTPDNFVWIYIQLNTFKV